MADDIIKTTETMLKEGSLTTNPHGAADQKAKLSGEFSFSIGILEDIMSRKPLIWTTMRAKHKSDKACDNEWSATEDGINEIGMRLRVKRISVLISALNSLMKLAEYEMRNV